ncbi:AAA family ATPase [Dictyobacter kobayashii]|uniref:ORC1/DEAH AAA+ ATPase domain-containing protein n=1 Tax=Dictyobacter kobayashii TaxID=2014872 RepID=A0A402AEN9_9CHLR|nr:ATP-binding protein [Dictyobacter kobayashii]GCE17555.1 hypothetical protein KDK_13550 [Dictyobacter kobayashii]
MQPQQQAKQGSHKAGSGRMSLVARICLFVVLLLAILITGLLAIFTGAASPSTLASGCLTLVVAIVAIIQIYPILFPGQPAAGQSAAVTAPVSPQHGPQGKVGRPIFFFNLPLSDPGEFYGRVAARTTLMARLANGGSSSIVGERRIGKTWLLEYVQLVAPMQSSPGLNYRVGRVSAAHPQSKSQASFVQHVLAELRVPSTQATVAPMVQLAQSIHALKELGIWPVLCIDEFEGFNDRHEFNHDFFDGLRALAQDDGLVLITTSKRPLKEIIEGLTGQTSPLFNIVQQITLKPFTEQEAEEFVEGKSEQAGFVGKEQGAFLQWSALYKANGERYWPPLRLQLVGRMLLEDKQGLAVGDSRVEDQQYKNEFMRKLDEEYQAVMRSGQ